MKDKILNPPSGIGIIGGGQLGKMMSSCAKQYGYKVTILDPKPDCPAMQVSDQGIVASYSDRNAVMELAKGCDVITYEFEHISADILIDLEMTGHKVIPSGRTLKLIQDKYLQKEALKQYGLPVPKFEKVQSEQDIISCIDKLGLPIILKKTKEGYDGKGNIVIKDRSEVKAAIDKFHTKELMVEEFIDFEKELSIVVACDGKETKVYPVAENIHKENILRLTMVPANVENRIMDHVQLIAENTINCLKDIGIFCIEMFLCKDNQILINEIAPRPHNSAHYTIEGCETSQYEQLIRILTGLPMRSTKLIKPSAMVNILGNDHDKGEYTIEGLENVLNKENVYVHLYGKSTTERLKKIGHITVCSDSTETAVEEAYYALNNLVIKAL